MFGDYIIYFPSFPLDVKRFYFLVSMLCQFYVFRTGNHFSFGTLLASNFQCVLQTFWIISSIWILWISLLLQDYTLNLFISKNNDFLYLQILIRPLNETLKMHLKDKTNLRTFNICLWVSNMGGFFIFSHF